MKKIYKIIGYLLLIIVIGLIGILGFVKFALPNVGDAPNLKVEATPERIEHGKYLANHVTVCIDCHSIRDDSKFSGPLVKGTEGKGGQVFDQKFGFPGFFTSKNITPYALANWTDGEIYRAITTGVSKDGHAFFPVMPYKYYGLMDKEDIYDIIAYIRTLKPIESHPAISKADFPMNFILNTIPSKASAQIRPTPKDSIAYGKYLTFSGGCFECHTKADDKGQKISGMDFAGGWKFPVGNGKFATSANITPDPETGIGNYTKQGFIARFKAYQSEQSSIGAKDNQTVMPWTMYAGMKEEDLGAIFIYLKSIKPIKNPIDKFIVSK